MNAVPTIKELEQRALTFARARAGLILAFVLAAIVIISSADAQRAREAYGAIRVLEHETAQAQKERHAASVAAIDAKRRLADARAHADSLEAEAKVKAAESRRLAQFVRIASETSLDASITPDSTIHVTVPRIVTTYIQSLYATIQAQDSALAARDAQVVRADTVIVTQDRIVRVDSVVVNSQDSTIVEEKRARPRLGFKAGVVVTTIVAVIVHFLR